MPYEHLTFSRETPLTERQRKLEQKRNKLRRELFNRRDEVEAKRNALISELEEKLEQKVGNCVLFNIEWELE